MMGERIRLLRKERKLTQRQLAEKLCVDCSSVTKWETQKANPDFEKQKMLADIFNVSVDYLLGREEKAAPQEEQQKPNTIKILGRDGSCVERQLTDDQIDLMKRMIEQMPDADDL